VLNDQFSGRTVKKTYLALVHGSWKNRTAAFTSPFASSVGRMGVDEVRGKPSTTDFAVVERFPAYTLVKALPATGRSTRSGAFLQHRPSDRW